MEIVNKLAILADAAKYDASCASSGGQKRDSRGGKGIGSTEGTGICHSLRAGRPLHLAAQDPADQLLHLRLPLLRQPRVQQRRRARASRWRRWSQLTLDFYRRNYIEGLFLSSGIIQSPDYTMEQLVRVARALREEHGFRGYIHLKTIPEAEPGAARPGRPLCRPADHQHRAADRAEPASGWRPRRSGARSGAPWARSIDGCGRAASANGRRSARRRLRAGRPEHADDRRRRCQRATRHPGDQRRPLRRLPPAARLLLGLQPDPRRQRRACR